MAVKSRANFCSVVNIIDAYKVPPFQIINCAIKNLSVKMTKIVKCTTLCLTVEITCFLCIILSGVRRFLHKN